MTSRQFRRALGRGQGKVGKIDCRCRLRSQRGGTKSSPTLPAYASPIIAVPSAMLFFSSLDRESTFGEIESSRRALPTRCKIKRTSAPDGPTFKYRDSYEATSFGRLRRARNFKTLFRSRSSEHNRAAEVHAPFGRPSPQMLEGVRIMMSRPQARAAFTRHGFMASD
jgi:hypothetical protein